MTYVKICGITRPADAVLAAGYGADAVGLVFAADSRRRVDPAGAAGIAGAIGARAACVGVFRNPAAEEVARILDAVRLDFLQFHGEEPPEFCRRFGVKWYKAFPYEAGLRGERIAAYGEPCFLIDGVIPAAGVPDPGGTGSSAWEHLRRLAGSGRAILAGGLNPDNVGPVVRALRPYGVDVSRGVERSPGVKDPDLVAAFLRRVREAEAGA